MTLDKLCQHIENFVNKANSRKFIAWTIATIALFTRYIDANSWMMITMLWLGIQGYLDSRRKEMDS
jgi:hypothetical protein